MRLLCKVQSNLCSTMSPKMVYESEPVHTIKAVPFTLKCGTQSLHRHCIHVCACSVWCLFFITFLRIFELKTWFFFPTDHYVQYFNTPYFIFVRDTLSYLALLGLHFALCLQPSTIHFTVLEWIIMLFFIGRLLMELNQAVTERQLYKKFEKHSGHRKDQEKLRRNEKEDQPENEKSFSDENSHFLEKDQSKNGSKHNGCDALCRVVRGMLSRYLRCIYIC